MSDAYSDDAPDETPDAASSLDELLAEWPESREEKAADEIPEPEADPVRTAAEPPDAGQRDDRYRMAAIEESLAGLAEERRVTQNREDFAKTVDFVTDRIGRPDIPGVKMIVEGELQRLRVEDARLRDVFDARHRDPISWERARERLLRDVSAKIAEIPDRDATEDRSLVASAVKSASQAAAFSQQDADDAFLESMKTMTEGEFERAKRKLGNR